MDEYESEAPGIRAALCKKCQRILPTGAFKRKMPRSQSRSLGYRGAHAVIMEGNTCNECAANKPKPLAERSEPALKQLASSGDIRMYEAQRILAKRASKAKANRSAATNARWDDRWTMPWATLREHLRAEIYATVQRRRFRRSQQVEVSYYNALLEAMRKVDAHAALRQKEHADPQWVEWWHHLSDAEIEALDAALQADIKLIGRSTIHRLHMHPRVRVASERLPYLDHIAEKKARLAALSTSALA